MEQSLKINVIIKNKMYIINASLGDSLLHVLQDSRLNISSPCGGKGLCGKCKVIVKQGFVPPSSYDKVYFNKKQLASGWRLACTTHIHSSLTIDITNSHCKCNEDKDSFLLASSYDQALDTIPMMVSSLPMSKDLYGHNSVTQYINHELKGSYVYSLKALKALGHSIKATISTSQTLYVLHNSSTVFNVGTEPLTAYGIAIDIGTTTLAFTLVNLLNGNVIDSYACMNPQQRYGHDIISRIQYASKSDNHLSEISTVLKKSLLQAIQALTSTIPEDYIEKIILSGNTAMIQLLLAIDSTSLSYTPFTMVTQDTIVLPFHSLFGTSNCACTIYCLPALATYIGGDITAGLILTKMYESDKIQLLIDIGTNGEMVIGNKNKLICASTAAGPAFEGANIQCGAGAVPGAICSYAVDNGHAKISTIGNKPPIGICGTGIIDIVSVLLEQRILSNTGLLKIDKASEEMVVVDKNDDTTIGLTQKDIRELQLAKSAIRSGLEIIIEEMNCSYDDIESVYIAGGFGSKLHLNHAAHIGLLPEALEHKVKPIGNASLRGAQIYMLHPNSVDLKQLADKVCTIELSNHVRFNEYFMKYINF